MKTTKEEEMSTDQMIEEALREFDETYSELDLDYPICCSGRDCGCMGETAKYNIKHFLKEQLQTIATKSAEEARQEIIRRLEQLTINSEVGKGVLSLTKKIHNATLRVAIETIRESK